MDVIPAFETDPVANWNGADDPAIWIHPTVGENSFFIGTDKTGGGRLELYNMDGSRFWTTEAGTKYNNVDVMYNFVLGTDTVDLVVACNNSDNTIDFFRIDESARELVLLEGNTACSFNNLYGLIVYHDLCNERFYVFLNRRTSNGYTYQFEFVDNGNGGIDINLVRLIDNLPTRTEGMVADYRLGHLYIAEESVGIWKYGAAPEDGNERTLMDGVDGPNLTPSVEGLTIYYSNDSTGYLLSASQGSDDFQVYAREGDNTFLGKFEIIENASAGIDGVSHQDGIDVVSFPIPGAFPHGVFISQDTDNTGGGFSNFKIVPWDSIAIPLDLRIDTTFSPRDLLESLCDTISIDTIDTIIDSTNFIQNINFYKRFIVFPNPSTDRLNLQGISSDNQKKPIVIYNALGKVIWKQTYQEVISVERLEAGLYILLIGNQQAIFVKK